MRIGIMLRHYNQHGGGVRVYTRNLLREMLALDSPHEFVLLYSDPSLIGTFRGNGRVREVALASRFGVAWDQLGMYALERRERLDFIFNPKYSIPVFARSRTAFVCHGLDWYVMPWASRWKDRLSHRYLIPRYARKADGILAVSNTARQHVIEFLGIDPERVRTVYLGVDEAFRRPVPQAQLEHVRAAYRLPERFFLYCGQIYPPKNFGRLLEAFATVGPELGMPLVVAGEHRWSANEAAARVERFEASRWVIPVGWVDRELLPAFYALAEALLLPSLYEACPLPILEAMASGTPVVTANRYGTQELAGQAAVLVDPEDVRSIAGGMHRVATEPTLRQALVSAGRERAAAFSWQRCARETLAALETIAASGRFPSDITEPAPCTGRAH